MANIKLNNNEYPIPDSTLAGPTADFVAHLGTIAGNGLKVVVGGVEYSVDSSKVAGAIAGLEGVFGELNSPDVGGDTITWDGNTDGRDVLFASCFKVSDKAFTKEEVIGATLVLTHNDEIKEILLTSDNVQQVTDGVILVFGQMGSSTGFMFVSTSISGDVMGEEIPSTGTYFASIGNGDYYISSLTFTV